MTTGLIESPGASAVAAAEAFARSSPETTRRRELVWQDPVPTAGIGASLPGLEYLELVMRGEVPPPPIAVLLKFQPIELGHGRAVFAGLPGEEHYNPIGVVHGGYSATLLDSVLGCAVHTTLDAGEGYTSATLETKYVRPITRDTGRVIATAEVLHRGRTQATASAEVRAGESGKLLAHGTSTLLILR